MTPELFSTDESFPPTLAAAHARIAAVRPEAYARTRNHLDGAVTRLSPYITHGFVTLPQVLAGVLQRQRLNVQHKFVQELGWREFFQHVWQHEGDGILHSLHPGPLPDAAYAREMPADVIAACTGVPVVDESVRTLYATGWLHNHARMWLASYLVHGRKVHWRSGADWMYGLLLDGNLASNHLSWQWVAGTGSHKPYLFNAENVARYAPAPWHSPGTGVDCSYDALERIAHSTRTLTPEPARARPAPVTAPALFDRPPGMPLREPRATDVQGRAVQLVHPWSLGDASPPAPVPVDAGPPLRVGVLVHECHAAWPWSEARWRFVGTRWAACCDLLWHGTAQQLQTALAEAASVRGCSDMHLQARLCKFLQQKPPQWLPLPGRRCASFSQYWRRVTRGVEDAATLLPPGPRH